MNFIIRTNSPVNWQHISWNPVFCSDTTRYTLAPQRLMFNKNIAAARDTLIHFATRDSVWGNRLVLVPEFQTVRSSDKDTEPATVHLTLKDETGTLLYRRDYTMTGANRLWGDSTAVDGDFLIPRLSARKIQVSFSVSNELNNAPVARLHILRDSILYETGADGRKLETGRRAVPVGTIPASVFSSFNRFDYGMLYRGWGQFAWNSNEREEPVRIAEMRVPDHNEYIRDGKSTRKPSREIRSTSAGRNSLRWHTVPRRESMSAPPIVSIRKVR